MTNHIEQLNLDGTGRKDVRVYDMPNLGTDYWPSVTDVPCPRCATGVVRWAEAGYAPGYRICDGCGANFMARGNASAPTLAEMD